MPELEDHYADLRATVADFADTVVAPVAAGHDRDHTFPYEVVAQMGKLGLFGLPFPEEYGGMGGDYFALARHTVGSVRPGRRAPTGTLADHRVPERAAATQCRVDH